MKIIHFISVIIFTFFLTPIKCNNPYYKYFTCQPKNGYFPYYISFVASVYKEECVLYEEYHGCKGSSIKFKFTNKKEDIIFEVFKGFGLYLSYQWKNHKGPKGKVDTFAVEIMYNVITVYDDFVPVYENLISTPDQNMWKAIQKCPRVRYSNGNCPKQRPCQIQSCMQKVRVPSYEYPTCKSVKLPSCLNNRGYCHGGKCITGEFGEYCKCEKKGFLRGPYLGQYCHITSDDEFEKEAKLLRALSVDVDYEENSVNVLISSTFENFYYRMFTAKLIELPAYTIKQWNSDLKANSRGEARWTVPVTANTSYILRLDARDGGDNDEVSYRHFTEIHTPGYSILSRPLYPEITHQKNGNLFLLKWYYYDRIPAKEFLIRMKTLDEDEEYVVSLDMQELLALRSNTTYVFSISAINEVGEPGRESFFLTYKTPLFKYEPKKHGKYDLAKWFFKNKTISLDGHWVNFKNVIRRDVRIKRVVIMLDTGTRSSNMSSVYDAVRFEQSYDEHILNTPYITASFRKIPLPKRLYLGDGGVYGEYHNGILDNQLVYQCYVIVWYISGDREEISVQYVGAVSKSQFPWMIVATTIACGTMLLTIFATLCNWCTHHIVLKRAAKLHCQQTKFDTPKTPFIEKVYSEDILGNPEYDMTMNMNNNLSKRKSTFSMMKY